MASISAPRLPLPSPPHAESSSHMVCSKSPRFLPATPGRSFPSSKRAAAAAPPARRSPDSALCRCRRRGDPRSDESPPSDGRRWDAVLQDVVRTAVRRWDEYVKSLVKGLGDGAVKEKKGGAGNGVLRKVRSRVSADWDWERWKRHFQEMEEQEKIVSIIQVP